MTDPNRTPSFWATLPGLLSGAAALLTAVFGGYALLRDRSTDNGVPQDRGQAIGASQQAEAASAATEECSVDGAWSITHGNGAVARLQVKQNGSLLVGSGREGANYGTLRGIIQGRNVDFEVEWSNNHTGSYAGTVSETGKMGGQNFDKTKPASQTSWFMEGVEISCRRPT